MGDNSLVETLALSRSIQLDPGSTGFDQFVDSGYAGSERQALPGAKKLIGRAASHADRRFFNWRDVKKQIDTGLQSHTSKSIAPVTP
ncbi:MAG: hypothetical protein U1E47_06680 [Rivihabitans pingtungensis]